MKRAAGSAVSPSEDEVLSGKPTRIAQIFGLCFYWAWVYLSFNSTSSINLSIGSNLTPLWVHLASMIVGVVTYALIIGLSSKSAALFETRRELLVAGIVLALGTACYALPLGFPEPVKIIGAALTGVASCWIVIYWGTIYSELSARDIVVFTAASFVCANIIYFLSLLLPYSLVGALTVLMALFSALLIPKDKDLQKRFKDSVAKNENLQAAATGRQLVPLSSLPWRVSIGLFVVMCVYGGVRVFVGVSDSSVSDGLLLTALLTFAVAAFFIVWGIFFKGNDITLGTVYKMSLPLLATALLLVALFGQEYVVLTGSIATACDITIEILSWILLADIARTTRVPAFLVFAIGRMAVQGGMFCGQLAGWVFVGQVVPFSIISIFALMMVMGFAFQNQDTLMVFEAPTPSERENVERMIGAPMESQLDAIATAHELTDRESEVFVLWATGHGSKYIQESLSISASTVKTHVRHIYEKCDVHSRAEIIALLEKNVSKGRVV